MVKFKPELLAPAGHLKVLRSAINLGADAVYFGMGDYNARSGAKNFTKEDAQKGMEYIKLNNKKGYVTLNTLLKDKELKGFVNTLKDVCDIGADGVIVQDLGVVSLIKEIAPELEIHASTQMAIHNLMGVNYVKNMGIKRVVLARELSFNEIKYIKENTDCEIEVFIHGALCACYSGRCYMSSFIGQRSGNRGKCAQPCRLNYEMEGKKGSLLSLKDLNSVNYIDRLKEIKVDSLKIEGRLKNEYYVAVVVDTYRRLIDNEPLNDEDYKLLDGIFNRGGFTDYFENYNKKNMFCYARNENPYSEYEKQAELKYKDRINQRVTDKSSKVPMDIKVTMKIGEKPFVCASSSGKSVSVEGDEKVSEAINSPLSYDRIKESFEKLSDTSFYLNEFSLIKDERIFMPVKELNELRRKAVSLFETPKINVEEKEIKKHIRKRCNSSYIAKVMDKEQLIWAQNNDKIEYVIADYKLCMENYKECDINKTVIDLPLIKTSGECEEIRKELEFLREKGFIFGNVNNVSDFSLLKGFKLFSDIYFNITNSYNKKIAENENIVVMGISPELNFNEIKGIDLKVPVYSLGYGYVRMMTLKNCIKKSVLSECRKGPVKMKDRMGEEFICDCDNSCHNKIFNPHKIIMSDKVKDFENAGVNYILLSFSYEKADECDKILNMYINNEEPEGKFTRGHFYRGVM